MNDRYLAALDYYAIIERLAEHTAFSASRALAERLRPSEDPETVAERLQETSEAKALLSVRPDVTIGGARDVRPILRRAEIEALLLPSELLDVRQTLLSARAMRYLLCRLDREYPLLADKALEIQPLTHIIDEIGRCLNDDGDVLDAASPDLARIRRELSVARDRVVDRLRGIISSEQNAPYLQEPLITERNGRYVIPLKAQFRNRIPGIVHDQSSSGATFFIEPLATVELNNRWHELRIEERHEVERILAELTRLVGQDADTIAVNVQVLAEIDLALAKAHYSIEIRGAEAEAGPTGWPTHGLDAEVAPSLQPLYLARARHPLLSPDTVVPIDVYGGATYTVLLVTGPNTGGKTVALKTVGLLAAMNQAGLHIPAMAGSRLPVFSGIYADIGDEQSIEQSLSTFSSHMSHIVDILARADERSLVILDELGAGTDPVEGSALAQALIDAFIRRRSLVFSSTHYSQLKVYAFSTDWVQNASVEFDVETLSPTYRLTIGLPGRSNAFAIASRLGLAEETIAAARQLLSPDDLQSEALLAHVASASEEAERARAEAHERLKEVQGLQENLRAKLANIEEARRQVLEEAREEGRRELDELREDLRRLRSGIGRGDANAKAIADALRAVEGLSERLAPIGPVEEQVPASSQALQVGDRVYVVSLKQTGELLSLSDTDAEVRVGGFRLRTQPGKLRFESRPLPAAAGGPQAPTVSVPKVESPGLELDMRGWRAEQVVPALDQYLDRAYLAGLPWVRLIHGKGMGVLRQVVRQHIEGHPLVASVRSGEQGEGGDGVTVAHLHKQRD